MANDPTASAEEWQRLLPRLVQWARVHLGRAGISDPGTAEDVVCRAVARITERGAYDKDRGPLGPFLWKVVWTEVQEERRKRARRPGDYGAAVGDEALRQLEDSFHQSLGDIDTAWRRLQKNRTLQALKRIRERVRPVDWEVFFRLAVLRHPAAEVARQVNDEFRPAERLEPAKAYRTAYRVRAVFNEEFRRAGIDPFKDRPDLSEICKELGIARPC